MTAQRDGGKRRPPKGKRAFQPSLFDQPASYIGGAGGAARRTDSLNTRQVAAGLAQKRISELQMKCYALYRRYGAMTNEEMVDHALEDFGVKADTIRPRVAQIRDLGLIYDTGDKRPSRDNKPVEVRQAVTDDRLSGDLVARVRASMAQWGLLADAPAERKGA